MRRGRPVGPSALAVAAALFLVFPATRPWGDATASRTAEAFASPAWLISHLSGALAFALLLPGILALRQAIPAGPGAGLARAASGATGFGVSLVLLYFGAETFALHEIGRHALRTGEPVLEDLVGDIRMGPVQVAVFGGGLLVLAVGAVLAAVSVWRSRRLPRWSAVPLAVGLVLYLPQFFAAPPVRVLHGGLVAVGCLLLAVVLWRAAGSSSWSTGTSTGQGSAEGAVGGGTVERVSRPTV
ncbi:hypothetical protein O2W15_23745 [Modestobacter sp. VKM Ac-2979]|uniref:hypothetical protein n=1 Tax=unclassified Modestobacter TaxID=2643866 RepID=UPI0022AB8398|nr:MULTISPECIES: hypothetical protein [unclassified Modestobacter]MCZ2814457.1 hypothetical protein [Modestobacter sp. VKM Ac-2979]MCZ2844783.1 hypothetical protein [Modestobacter sp. VKM Ac-2980]